MKFEIIDDLNKLTLTTQYCGETVRDDNWRCDVWRVTVTNPANNTSYSTEFYTGLGKRHKPKHRFDTAKPKPPTIADVMYSFVLDGAAIDVSFPDWCSEYEYSEDSIKALNIYSDCCKTGRAMRGMFTHDELAQLRDVLANY